MTQELSSVDLRYLVAEAQSLVGAKVNKIYHPRPTELHILLHVPGEGKKVLVIALPSLIYLGSIKESVERPSGFAMGLRKRLTQAKIKSIEQLGFDRILKISFDREYTFYIELFGKGNMILTEGTKVLASMVLKGGTRTFKHGSRYEPPESTDPTAMDSFAPLWTGDKSLVKWAATSIGLGGRYAEELCARTGLDKSSKEIIDADLEKIHAAFTEMISLPLDPQRIPCDKFTPFKLKTIPESKPVAGFMSSIASVAESSMQERQKETATAGHTKTLDKQRKMIAAQTKRVEELQKKADESTKAGEYIYENYGAIKDLLEEIDKKRKNLSTEDFEGFLKAHKKIKGYNLKEHSITLKS